MAVLYGKNYGKPTLDLNFARNKSLVDTTTEKNYVTFSRAQSGNEATYIGSDGLIKYAAADEARFDHDPVTGESLGLLVEEARTNSFTYSNDISQNVYSKNNVTYTANAAVAPDGTTTATKIIPTTTSAVHSISRLGTLGLRSMRSVYVKAAGYTSCTVYDINTGAKATINLTTGELTNTGYFDFSIYSQARGRITNAGNGWWRIEVGYDSYSAVNNPFYIYPNNDTTFAGDGTSGILVWGYQQEENAYPFPTSYIPTSGTTVTRAADVADITGTNFSGWYNPTAGSFYVQESSRNNNLDKFYIFISNGANNDRLWISKDSINRHTFNVYDSTNTLQVVSASAVLPSSSGLVSSKFVGSYLSGDSNSVLNGILSGASVNNAFIRSGSNSAYLGRSGGGNYLNGHISRLTYYPKRLPDIELQQLTK